MQGEGRDLTMKSTFFRTVGAAAGGLAASAGLLATPALAEEALGYATPWQLGLQGGVTPNMADIIWFHDSLLLPITGAISLLVLGLLIWVAVRYNERANPVPSKTTHNTRIEVIWTIVPIIILAWIAIPSFRILTEQRTIPEADMTVKVTGHQWYWSYEYPDEAGMTFDSVMLEDDELQPGQHRLLEVDNQMVVPVGKTVRLIATAADVIHAWTVPAFGVKIDTIPGRLNEAWFRADSTGTFYGQCSELCGIRHAFMPIKVTVMSEPDYANWLEGAKAQFAAIPMPTPEPGSQPAATQRLAQSAGR